MIRFAAVCCRRRHRGRCVESSLATTAAKGGAPWGAREASPIPSCEVGAGGAPWGAMEASPIPFCEGGAGAVPWGAREAFPTPPLQRRGWRSAMGHQGGVLSSKQGERCKKNKKRRSSPHVEIDSTCGDNRQFIICIGEGYYQVVKKSLVLFTVCLFFCSSESFEKFGLPPEKKTGGKLWAGPPIGTSQRGSQFAKFTIWGYEFSLPFGSYVETCTSFYVFSGPKWPSSRVGYWTPTLPPSCSSASHRRTPPPPHH